MTPSISTPKILIASLSGTCENYTLALHNAGFEFCFPPGTSSGIPYTLSELIDLEFDLLLLPGGGDISPLLYLPATVSASIQDSNTNCNPPDYVTDLLQFQLLQLALLRKKPILGICKGMQLLNVYFGGDLYPDLPTSAEHCYREGDRAHPLYFPSHFPSHTKILGGKEKTSMALYELLKDYTVVNSAHHQGIRHLGKHMLTIQHAQDYLPETIAHSYLPILGLQWHPERLPGFKEKTFGKLIHLLLQLSQL